MLTLVKACFSSITEPPLSKAGKIITLLSRLISVPKLVKGQTFTPFVQVKCGFCEGLIELLCTVHSEERLQSCIKLRNFETAFNKDKSVDRKRPKICTCCRVSEAKVYLYHSTTIGKGGSGFDEIA